MAQEVEIFFKVDGLETYITDLNDLEKVLNQVKGATDATAAATKDLEKDVDDATKGIEESERRLNALEGGIKTLAGSFEILAGSAALLGLEDNEFFAGLEQNVVGVLALSQGVIDASEGLRLLKDNTKLASVAQRIFNGVAKANPYVLLATAVIALTAAIGGYILKTKAAEKAERERKEELKKLRKEQEAQARINAGIIADEQELRNINRSESEKELKEILAREDIKIKAYNEEIDKQAEISASYASKGKLLGKAAEEQSFYINKAAAIIEEENEKLNESNIIRDAVLERLQTLKEAREKGIEVTDAETASIEAQNLALQQQAEAAADILDEQFELEEELYVARLTQREQEERDIENTYYERLNLANGNAELIKQIEEQFEIDKQTLKNQYDEEEKQANQEKLDELEEQQKNYNQNLIAAEEQLQAAKINAAQQGFAVLSALAGENENLQKTIFIASQAFEAAQIAIQGTRDIAKTRSETRQALGSLAQEAAILTPRALAGDPFAAAGLAAVQGSIATVSASGAATIAGIKLNTAAGIAGVLAASIGQLRSAKDTGGGGTQITATAATPRAALPSYTTSQGEDIILGEPRSQQQGGGGPIQAYVIASDVTSAQQANQQIENLSRL